MSESYIRKLTDELLALGAKSVVLTGVSFDEDLLGAAVCNRARTGIAASSSRGRRMWHGTGRPFRVGVYRGVSQRKKHGGRCGDGVPLCRGVYKEHGAVQGGALVRRQV